MQDHGIDQMRNTNNLISSKQFGFMNGSAISVQLLIALDDLTHALADKGKC